MPLSAKNLNTSRNLVLVNTPGWQAVEDFLAIRKSISATASDITVIIASTRQRDPTIEELASRKPALIVSPTRLGSFMPLRGRIYEGRAIDKDVQLARLQELGIPIPRTTMLTKGFTLDPAEWGSHVIVKPASSRSSHGIGFSITPSTNVNFGEPESYPDGHPGRLGPLMVQEFIDTGRNACHYRVNTLFGQALYCLLNRSTERLPELSQISEEFRSNAIATNSQNPRQREFQLVADQDVIDLAARCHAAFPNVPLKGVDIVRHHKTGKLYVLELNYTSNAWHISSDYFASYRNGPITKDKMIGQFGAWDIAAAALIQRTRYEAL